VHCQKLEGPTHWCPRVQKVEGDRFPMVPMVVAPVSWNHISPHPPPAVSPTFPSAAAAAATIVA